MRNNYIIIGDSITYGIGDFENCGWATMFKKYIVNKDDSKECTNYVHIAGFPGARSNDILDKINSILQLFKHEEFENIVLLSIGINDTQEFNGTQRNSLEKYKENIIKIAKSVIESNCKLIILGLTRIESDEKFFWKPNKYYDNEIISEYDRDLKLILEYDTELENICKSNKINYIPMQDILQKEDFIDGLHPNTKGHRKIFERIIERLGRESE